MDTLHALVRMRYRPSGDVLVGRVEQLSAAGTAADEPDVGGPTAVAGEHDDRIEQLDADTSRSWRLVARGPHRGRQVLTGFQVLGVAARLDTSGAVLTELLPDALARAATEMVTSAARSASRLRADDRMRARAEVELSVPLVELLRLPDLSSGPARGASLELADLGTTRALATALTHLADTVQAELALLPSRRLTDPGDHSERFVDAVRALASIVSRHRLPAPGAGRAATEAVRGGLPLSASERALVRRVLAELDDVHQWREAAHSLEVLAATLDEQRSRRPGRLR
jgi:hypothetical protein